MDDEDDYLVACPHCGEDIHDEAVQCPYCEQYISSSDFKKPMPKWLVAIIIVTILSFVLLSMYWGS